MLVEELAVIMRGSNQQGGRDLVMQNPPGVGRGFLG